MHKLARLNETERRRIVDGFLDEIFGDLDVDPGLVARMRMARPDLPENPSATQIEAWIELAELVADPDFRRRMREMSERGAAEPQPPDEPAQMAAITELVAERASAAAAGGVDPRCAAAAPVVDEVVAAFAVVHGRDDDPAYRAWLGELVATFTDARAERYWQLLAVINGWPPAPPTVPAWEWLQSALAA